MNPQKLLLRLSALLCLLVCFTSVNALAAGNGDISSGPVPVSGIVVDAANQPIVGAFVLQKGTSNGTMTDVDGKFTIELPSDATFEVSSMGYVTQEIVVGGKSYFAVVLAEDTQLLEEVVVVGYGTTKKVNLTGAVSVIKADDLQDRSALSASKMLQGTVPGLNITNRSGRPGQSSTINIRGLNSINGGSPLIIIDGVEGDLERINPADIESISVLKDASSAAIYGARASFGVIIVTTKEGADEDGKPVVRYSGRAGFTAPTTSTQFENRGYYSVYWTDYFMKTYSGTPYTNGLYTDADMMELWIRRYDKKENPTRPWVVVDNRNGVDVYNYYANTDWYHELFNDIKPTTSHSISFTGGTDRVKYMISGSYNMEKGVFRVNTDTFKKFNFRSKVSFDVTKWLNVSNNTSFYSSDYTYPGRSGVNNSFRMTEVHALASYPAINPDGTSLYNTQYRSEPLMDGLVAILTNNRHKNQDKVNYLSTMTELTITPFKGMVIKGNFTYNNATSNSMNRTANADYSVTPGVVQTINTGNFLDKLSESVKFERYIQANAFATYNTSIAEKHNIKVMAGYTYETMHTKNLSLSGENLLSTNLNDLALVGTNADGEKITNVGGGQEEYAIMSSFMRLNYDYKEKYLLEFNGRFDGTSRFADGSRWGFFPSLSAGWKISEEAFFAPAKQYVDNLKLRGSFGRLGNQQVDAYAYIRSINLGTLGYTFGSTKPVYATIDAPKASDLTWEVVDQYNVGLDATFLSNRLAFSAEAYIRDTKDMLTKGVTLPGVYGTSSPDMNAADMRTKGYELTLSWKDQFMLAGKPFRYNASVVFSDYITKITRFDNPQRLLSDYYEGMTYGEIWGYTTGGFFKSDEEAANYAVDQTAVNGIIIASAGDECGLRAGDLKYLDLDDDGKISKGLNTVDNPGDRKIIGNSEPRFQYGINLGANWMGFDLAIFLQGVGRVDWYPAPDARAFWGLYARPFSSFIPADFMSKIWTEDNPDSFFPRPRGYIAMKDGRALGTVNDKYLQNVGYCRLKNLTFGYTIPESVLRKAKISQLRVYFSGENLGYVSELKKGSRYVDPEQAMTDGNLSVYPWQKTFMFGIDLTF